MKPWHLTLLPAFAIASFGCGSVNITPGDAGGAGGGGGGVAAPRCPAGHFGGSMVAVPDAQGGSYCMDATEVTNASYAAFLATKPSRDGLPAACSETPYAKDPEFATFVPSKGWPPAAGRDSHPVVFVTWCDAAGYCAADGKRLCGRSGGGALRNSADTPGQHDDRQDAHVSEWFNACSRGGARGFVYGSTFEPGRCKGDYDGAEDQTVPVGDPACEGGYSGLFDLGGSVAEYLDACYLHPENPEDLPGCVAAGGVGDVDHPGCSDEEVPDFNGRQADIGIRCCADTLPSP